jgi:predicted nucleic acid-binding protein
VDTNVVLDLLLGREPWASQAKPMWTARDAGQVETYLPASVLTDIFYICRKQIGADPAKLAVEECLQRFVILPVDRTLLEAALQQVGPDFEDNVQIACAQAAGVRLIVTRNVADFAHGSIPAVEPPDVLSHLVP